ncbi:MAG: hypothetical protein A2840_00635 [Candidatus Buchananbacteria bacterium RIFCSPHIGHO2_01_FULL_47_11b]|uniref:Uncharacterized protein n=1 Tax=Candidatus Buchananbacteria bacterium RIFCSPHIGHO2_01_FULL_47_11b TaxID=1797537 RepID=A0A1G1Y378_9BACT|nr:MAG: hypothetical protein A2840_00635 [Candidatus Buchananbacteria bacterium RIFCSPHIGHO2_01_FULL_47_11b]
MANDGQQPKQSRIEKIPESLRRQLVLMLVSIAVIILVPLWLFNLQKTLATTQLTDPSKTNEIAEIGSETKSFLQQAQENFENIKQQFTTIDSRLTETQTTQQDIEQLKEKLENKFTATSTDTTLTGAHATTTYAEKDSLDE